MSEKKTAPKTDQNLRDAFLALGARKVGHHIPVKGDEPLDEKKFAHLGGTFVGRIPVPIKREKDIDFSSIPGVRCVMPPPERVHSGHLTEKPEKSVEKEDDTRE